MPDMTRLTKTDIWEGKVEKPDEVDALIERLTEWLKMAKRLRKLSADVWGEEKEDGAS